MGIEYECGTVRFQTQRIPVAGMTEHFKKKGMKITAIQIVYKQFIWEANADQDWYDEHPRVQVIENLPNNQAMYQDPDVIEYIDVTLETTTISEEALNRKRRQKEYLKERRKRES